MEERLHLLNIFQEQTAQYFDKIYHQITVPILMNSINNSNTEITICKIKLLIRTWRSLYKLRKKQDKEQCYFTWCPMMMMSKQMAQEEPNTLLQKQALTTFKKKFKKTIVNELEKNEEMRRKQNMVDKLRKIDYYDRKNQQSKWSTLYAVEHDASTSGMELRFFDLENVEKEIHEMVQTFNDFNHKSQKVHKLEWDEPLFITSRISQVYSAPFELSSSQKTSKRKIAPPSISCLENCKYFVPDTNVDASNLFEEEKVTIDRIMLTSCLDMEMLKKLRQINAETPVIAKDADDESTRASGSVFIRVPIQVSGEDHMEDKSSKIRPILFQSKLQQLREAILRHE
ncbi:hypothetical protein C9374_009102 [Naegleria lovaniensis]|uniref:Uncharacterized protein n=1 Tax=Naegleria lovaniensis TaxID=51637 RepID=A0AA88GJF4_NAELO|nr:uncharacterized protein C9374_009102 [Naegleria lovaniensis]KAG2377586.1 hypothetical protein C9374_009102 [Naegleria lovaniensis]